MYLMNEFDSEAARYTKGVLLLLRHSFAFATGLSLVGRTAY